MRFPLVLFALQLLVTQSVMASDTLFRMHGSNTIGATLGPELVRGWLFREGYTGIRTIKHRDEEISIVGRAKGGQHKIVEIKSHGSGTSFKSIKKGLADIGMSSRPIKGKENNNLKKFGEMTRLESEYVIGLDGIAVIVNMANPVHRLEKSIIKKIFTGEITQWNKIDRKLTGPIHVYARDNKSGTFDTFKALVIGKKAGLANTAKRYESNDKLSDDVSKDVFGIGFVGLPSVRNSKALAVSEEGTQAKKPRSFEISTEDYVLARRLYMYVADINVNQNVKSFISYVQSEHGQKIVDMSGFISQNLKIQSVELSKEFPEEYLKFTSGAKRLSLNFRFNKGTTKPDNKAVRDIARLVSFLSKDENKGKRVMLFGFSDRSESNPVFSVDLSTYRVDWVSDLLVLHGIDPVRVRAYGDAIPVASNEDVGGRHKNRRVEVWLM